MLVPMILETNNLKRTENEIVEWIGTVGPQCKEGSTNIEMIAIK